MTAPLAGVLEDGRDFAGRPRPSRSPRARAHGLRTRMTWSEKRLWRELRKLDLNFRRQAPIGSYFADFSSHGRKLVIEVDGRVHQLFPEVGARDAKRQAWVVSQGYEVLRFTDQQVADDLHAVVQTIEALLLDGGGLGGGGCSETVEKAPVGSDAHLLPSVKRRASTTIPGPSSIEEEGGRQAEPAASDHDLPNA